MRLNDQSRASKRYKPGCFSTKMLLDTVQPCSFCTFPTPIASRQHGRFQGGNHFPISPMENRQLRTLLLQKVRPFQARNLELVHSSHHTLYYYFNQCLVLSVIVPELLSCMYGVWCIVSFAQVHFHRTEQVPLHTHLSWAFSAF